MGRGSKNLGYAESLLYKLISQREKYFHGDYINSDGRRVLEEVFKILLEEYPWLRKRIWKIRRDPSIYRVVELYNDLFE